MDVGEKAQEPPGCLGVADAGRGATGPRCGSAFTLSVIDPSGLVAGGAMQQLQALGTAALGEMRAVGEVRVRLLDDAGMAAAHERYSGIPGTTDVLTFDLGGLSGRAGLGAAERELDVDMLVCVDEARRQAGARGLPVERELLLYVIHGVLHCRGHDDHDPALAAAMHAEEDRILETIGVGRTFSAPLRTGGGGGGGGGGAAGLAGREGA